MLDLDGLEALPTEEWATSGHRVFVANGPHVADFVGETEAERAVAAVNALPALLAELRRLQRVEEKARELVKAAASPQADGGEMWYAEAVSGPVDELRAALEQ